MIFKNSDLIHLSDKDVANILPSAKIVFPVSCHGWHAKYISFNILGLGNQIAHYAAAYLLINQYAPGLLLASYPFIQIARPSKSLPLQTLLSRSLLSFSKAIQLPCTKIFHNANYDHLYDPMHQHLYLKSRIVTYALSNLLCHHGSDIQKVFLAAALKAGLKTTSNFCTSSSLGVHVRSGDFDRKMLYDPYDSNSPLPPNSCPPLDFYRKSIHRLKPSSLTLYASGSKTEIRQLISALNIPSECKLSVFSPYASALSTLSSMSAHSTLIQSNSSLSLISSIISGQQAIYPGTIVSWGLQDYFSNFQPLIA